MDSKKIDKLLDDSLVKVQHIKQDIIVILNSLKYETAKITEILNKDLVKTKYMHQDLLNIKSELTTSRGEEHKDEKNQA